jgi:hypothetical protein
MWIESKFVEREGDKPKPFMLKGGTGNNHEVLFCGKCGTYVWSRYHGAPGDALFVCAGTLDKAEVVTPDIHIFTRGKLPRVKLPEGARAFNTFYDIGKEWPPQSRARRQTMLAEACASQK